MLARAPSAEERLAQSIARRLATMPIVVRCANVSEAPGMLGMTPFLNGASGHYLVLMPVACRELVWFRANPRAYDPSACRDRSCLGRVSLAVQSLQALAHESFHAMGYEPEATAECYGVQSVWYVAYRLGASVQESETIALWYWRNLYPLWRVGSHPEYWSPQCRDGGALDIRPYQRVWPS